MRSPKIFIVVVFVIGFLFIVGINLGATHHDETIQAPAWLTAVVRPQPLRMAELSPTSASCLGQGGVVVAAGSTCTFAIQQSPLALRVVTLQLVQGTSAMVTLTQEETLPVQQSLAGANTTTNADLKVYPGKAHGMLRIECLNAGGAPACLLKLS